MSFDLIDGNIISSKFLRFIGYQGRALSRHTDEASIAETIVYDIFIIYTLSAFEVVMSSDLIDSIISSEFLRNKG